MNKRLTVDDFVSGLLAGLAMRGFRTISIRGDQFDRAVTRSFDSLQEQTSAEEVDVLFRIRRHPLHGDSATARDAISRAAQRDLIGFDNPEYQDIRLKLSEAEAKALLDRLPFAHEVFLALADEFIESYQGAAV